MPWKFEVSSLITECSDCSIAEVDVFLLIKDVICYNPGDELLSDSFTYNELHNGVLWEVEGKVSTVPYHLLIN